MSEIKAVTGHQQRADNSSSGRPKFLTGLIGAPIAQSAAPAMHEFAADAFELLPD
jgi:hypothetical protein